jgi:putative addiction module component (TIGR02574 family)
MSTVEQIEANIVRLPRKLQLQVVERLNARLWPSGFAPEVEAAWSKTIKRRLDEMDSGNVEGVSAARVFAKSRRLLGRR